MIKKPSLFSSKPEDKVQFVNGDASDMASPTMTLYLVNQKHIVIRLVWQTSENGTVNWYLEISIVNIHIQAAEAIPEYFAIWVGPGPDNRGLLGEAG
jgi:hypothetical protein